MSRVATIPLQRTMADAISRAQGLLATTQQRLSTGKKVSDFADLGTEAVRNLSAHSLLARQDAQTAVAKRVDTTMALYDAQLGGIESATGDLRTNILTAIGTGQSAGLQASVEAAFHQYRSALNAQEGGVPMFAGSQTDAPPFKPEQLADLVGKPASDAFGDDEVRASARVAEGVDVTYGITARDAGGGLYDAFRALAEMGTIGDKPTAAQLSALNTVVGQLDTGLSTLRAVNADNGRRQSQVDTLATRGEQRALVLKDVISTNEDADLGQVATDLAQQKTMLEASYSVFGQLSGLSLVQFLR